MKIPIFFLEKESVQTRPVTYARNKPEGLFLLFITFPMKLLRWILKHVQFWKIHCVYSICLILGLLDYVTRAFSTI